MALLLQQILTELFSPATAMAIASESWRWRYARWR